MQQDPGVVRLFVHGSGRSGTEAWPGVSGAADEFVSFDPAAPVSEQVDRLVAACEAARTVIYAHSIGGVPAVLAAASTRLDVAGR